MKKNIFLPAFLLVMFCSTTNANAADLSDNVKMSDEPETVISDNFQLDDFRFEILGTNNNTEVVAANETQTIKSEKRFGKKVKSSKKKIKNNSGDEITNISENEGVKLAGLTGGDAFNAPIYTAGKNDAHNDSLKMNTAMYTAMGATYTDPTFMTKSAREEAKAANKYASADWDLTAEPVSNQYDSKTLWVKQYATFESVDTKSTTDVSNVAWGGYFGGDSQVYELGNGWDSVFGLHIGYNGSHQAWGGNSAYQNGTTFGITNTVFKGNFFDTITFGAGANMGKGELLDANNHYADDDFALFHTGVANKLGYNFEFDEGKYVVQPSFLTSYTYSLAYNSHYPGFRRQNQNLHSIGLEPGVKFIANLDNGWQPYASVSVVWNLMTKRYNFRPYQVAMPELAAKPYVRYGVGLKKTWGDRVCGFLQAHITNGGRTGVGLQAGFRWTIGK